MQSEEFDIKIQQAADHHHPNYDEKAWTKMEKLLDKHLPQKKDDNRKVIVFLLLFLLLGGAGTVLLINKSHHSSQSLAAKQNLVQQTIPASLQNKTTANLPGNDNKLIKTSGEIVQNDPAEKKPAVSSSTSQSNPVDQNKH